MKGSEIIDLVIVKLEEYTPFRNDVEIALNAGGNSSDEVQPVLSYISKSLAQSANEMLRVMPLQWLVYKTVTPTPTCYAEDYDACIGHMSLPEDFLRLHTLQMVGWERPVHRTISEGDADYKSQFCKWTRGTKQKPVAVLAGLGLEGQPVGVAKVLYYYSVDEGTHEVSVFRYIPCFDEDNHYDTDAAELIALNCARKVAEVFGMTEAVTIFTNEITTVLENVRQ